VDIVFNGIGIRPSENQYGTPATVIDPSHPITQQRASSRRMIWIFEKWD